MRRSKKLSTLIQAAEILGLPASDVTIAREYITYNEHGLCLDTIITQLSENNIPIDSRVYTLIDEIGTSMDLTPDSWQFLEELIVPTESPEEIVRIELNKLFGIGSKKV